QEYAKRPKRKFVSASTKEYAWAEYLRSWVDRVERVGNLNYPDEARRRRIGGLVVISVAVRRDGSVEATRIVQSSHVPMLANAALRIVKLSAPFAPLPRPKDDPDVLHVTRTWRFVPGGELVVQSSTCGSKCRCANTPGHRRRLVIDRASAKREAPVARQS